MNPKRKRVVGAILERNGKILIGQRKSDDSFPNQWEFPGGKVRSGESEPEALKRELQEELGIEVTVGELFFEVDHDYPSFLVSLGFYLCTFKSKEPLQQLAHQALRWVSPKNLDQFDFLEADLPVLKKLLLRIL